LGARKCALGTSAQSIPQLIEQLGIARFGHRPSVGDPFCGGGSTPFEAARIGCRVVASDLNPIAAMLTWSALNVIGASTQDRTRIAEEQEEVAAAVDAEITHLGVEHDENGNPGKA
jgi:putative DNA methylase